MLDELAEGSHQVLHQLKLVVIHIRWQVEVRFTRANPIELNGVLVRNEGIFLAVKEENGALRLCDQVNVAESLVDDYCEEAGPA